jgi:hypothetical protein
MRGTNWEMEQKGIKRIFEMILVRKCFIFVLKLEEFNEKNILKKNNY